jgi:uncharacterized membrane protein YczE
MMKHIIRLLLYFTGLFIISIGINLAIKSALGVSPVSAFTVPVSRISGINLGTITVIVYTAFVFIQITLLGKKFRLKLLLQSPFSLAFGFFVDYTGSLLEWINPSRYLQQIIMLFLSIVICSAGAAIYIAMDVMPNAPEGLILSICERFAWPFSNVKIISDCAFVATGIILSLLFIGKLTAIREGTAISALITGKMISVFLKICEPLKRAAFYEKKEKAI